MLQDSGDAYGTPLALATCNLLRSTDGKYNPPAATGTCSSRLGSSFARIWTGNVLGSTQSIQNDFAKDCSLLAEMHQHQRNSGTRYVMYGDSSRLLKSANSPHPSKPACTQPYSSILTTPTMPLVPFPAVAPIILHCTNVAHSRQPAGRPVHSLHLRSLLPPSLPFTDQALSARPLPRPSKQILGQIKSTREASSILEWPKDLLLCRRGHYLGRLSNRDPTVNSVLEVSCSEGYRESEAQGPTIHYSPRLINGAVS